MRAVALFPGKPDSMHLTDLPEPDVEDAPGGRGVLVEVLRVGVDGTDEKITDAGRRRPGGLRLPGDGPRVARARAGGRAERADLEPGDYVTAIVRRPGGNVYDRIGTSDMTTDETYQRSRSRPRATRRGG